MAMTDEETHLKKILAFLLKAKGFDGHHYKNNYIKRRIAVRMRATGVATYQDYFNILQASRQEPSLLLDKLTIHVTEFFRDPEVYRSLRENILPEMPLPVEGKVRIWCAGCSTGEEPYSLAILLREWSFGHPEFDFEILATDIDAASIRTAEKGEYPMEALLKMPRVQATRWFQTPGNTAHVISELKRCIRFRVHDLLGDWPPTLSGFQFVFCRNMLIYLTAPHQQKIYQQFAKVLLPGGYLVLGLTETLLGQARQFYRCVDVKHRIYQVSGIPTPGITV
jgi:chemotaxis protein methyltransferase CheR